ncbi:hypothetical protein [Aliamphritea spongicola]|nr:hypothetical protein [Aliamphritea spongicola]
MLSARRDDIDKVMGLEFGADDYLGKPYSPGNWWPGFMPLTGAAPSGKPLPARP